MNMHWTAWIVVVLAFVHGGWFAFDGTHAVLTGDYITPKSGPYAGQLGPWSKLVSAVGIEPRSTLMKSIFSAYGTLWLVIIVCFIFKLPWAWWAMLAAAIGAAWYIWFGTILSLTQVGLLLLPVLSRAGKTLPGAG
ncbi:MAG: hypothetical protein ACE5EC_04145 [Phycisphaerae bacterium]